MNKSERVEIIWIEKGYNFCPIIHFFLLKTNKIIVNYVLLILTINFETWNCSYVFLFAAIKLPDDNFPPPFLCICCLSFYRSIVHHFETNKNLTMKHDDARFRLFFLVLQNKNCTGKKKHLQQFKVWIEKEKLLVQFPLLYLLLLVILYLPLLLVLLQLVLHRTST